MFIEKAFCTEIKRIRHLNYLSCKNSAHNDSQSSHNLKLKEILTKFYSYLPQSGVSHFIESVFDFFTFLPEEILQKHYGCLFSDHERQFQASDFVPGEWCESVICFILSKKVDQSESEALLLYKNQYFYEMKTSRPVLFSWCQNNYSALNHSSSSISCPLSSPTLFFKYLVENYFIYFNEKTKNGQENELNNYLFAIQSIMQFIPLKLIDIKSRDLLETFCDSKYRIDGPITGFIDKFISQEYQFCVSCPREESSSSKNSYCSLENNCQNEIFSENIKKHNLTCSGCLFHQQNDKKGNSVTKQSETAFLDLVKNLDQKKQIQPPQFTEHSKITALINFLNIYKLEKRTFLLLRKIIVLTDCEVCLSLSKTCNKNRSTNFTSSQNISPSGTVSNTLTSTDLNEEITFYRSLFFNQKSPQKVKFITNHKKSTYFYNDLLLFYSTNCNLQFEDLTIELFYAIINKICTGEYLENVTNTTQSNNFKSNIIQKILYLKGKNQENALKDIILTLFVLKTIEWIFLNFISNRLSPKIKSY